MNEEIEEAEEVSFLEKMLCEAAYAAVRDWLKEDKMAEQVKDAVREGVVEALEGVVIPHLGKVSKN